MCDALVYNSILLLEYSNVSDNIVCNRQQCTIHNSCVVHRVYFSFNANQICLTNKTYCAPYHNRQSSLYSFLLYFWLFCKLCQQYRRISKQTLFSPVNTTFYILSWSSVAFLYVTFNKLSCAVFSIQCMHFLSSRYHDHCSQQQIRKF